MEDKNGAKPTKQAKMLLSKFRNMVQLCEQKDANGSIFFFVQVIVGNKIFFVDFDDLQEAMEQFGQIVKIKRGK